MSSTDLDLLIQRARTFGGERIYKVNEVPASPAYPYRVVSLGSPDPRGRMLSGESWRDRRFAVQHFARTHDAVTALAEASDAAFMEQHLPEFPGEPFCWREVSTPPYRDPDDSGVLAITHTYRF